MPGVRGPQPPSTGLPPTHSNSRRRHSLPALSSSQFGNFSSNSPRINANKDFSKTFPEDVTVRKQNRPTKHRNRGEEKHGSVRNSDFNGRGNRRNEKATENLQNYNDVTQTSPETSPSPGSDVSTHSNGLSSLQGKIQSDKSNAIFIFKFDENEVDKNANSLFSVPSRPPVRLDDVVSPVLDINPSESQFQYSSSPSSLSSSSSSSLSSSSTSSSLSSSSSSSSSSSASSSDYLSNSDKKVFSGKRHKKYRLSGKLISTMSPVQELKTPTDESELCSDEDTSSDSGTECNSDYRSWTDSASPSSLRSNEKITNYRREPLKLNANSNQLLKRESDVSEHFKSALSLSPRNSYTTSPSLSPQRSPQQSPQRSPQRLRKVLRRGSLDTAVGAIFANLKPSSPRLSPNTTSPRTSSIAGPPTNSKINPLVVSSDRPQSAMQPPARLLSRRRSLGSLTPEPIGMRAAVPSIQRRRSITEVSRNPLMSVHAAAAALASRRTEKQVPEKDNNEMWEEIRKTRYLRTSQVDDAGTLEEIQFKAR